VNTWPSCRSWGGKVGRRGHSWAPKVASRKERHNQHDTTTQNKERKKTTQNTSTERKEKEKHKNNKKGKDKKGKERKKKKKKKRDENQGHKGCNGFIHCSHPSVPGAQGMQRFHPLLPPSYIGHKGNNGFIHRSHPHSLLGHKGCNGFVHRSHPREPRTTTKPAEQGTRATMVSSIAPTLVSLEQQTKPRRTLGNPTKMFHYCYSIPTGVEQVGLSRHRDILNYFLG
jgi:hypothetical protein